MNLIRKATLRTIAKILLMSYLGFLSLGFVHIMHMASMNSPMVDCPFEHILTGHSHTGTHDIQAITTTILITVLSYLGSVVAVRMFFIIHKKKIYDPMIIFSVSIRQQLFSPHLFLYQLLFSEGILHPRPF